MSAKEALRDMLIAAGLPKARAAFKKAYEEVRRPVIMEGRHPPAPQAAKDRLWAAREAMKAHDGHSYMWADGRDIDYKLIRKREGRD